MLIDDCNAKGQGCDAQYKVYLRVLMLGISTCQITTSLSASER